MSHGKCRLSSRKLGELHKFIETIIRKTYRKATRPIIIYQPCRNLMAAVCLRSPGIFFQFLRQTPVMLRLLCLSYENYGSFLVFKLVQLRWSCSLWVLTIHPKGLSCTLVSTEVRVSMEEGSCTERCEEAYGHHALAVYVNKHTYTNRTCQTGKNYVLQ